MPSTEFMFDSRKKQLLHDNWTVTSASVVPRHISSDTVHVHAAVPGVVHMDLLREGIIKDPFLGLNEKQVEWVAETDWIYETSFEVSDELRTCEHGLKLVCEGLDSFGEVFLDNQPLGQFANGFIPHRYDISGELSPGKHYLKIHFFSPVGYQADMVAKHGRMPDSLGTDRGWVRKPQYSYGWDWGPILPTTGIWRPIYIQQKVAGEIEWFVPHYKNLDKNGILDVDVGFNTNGESDHTIQAKLSLHDTVVVEKTLKIDSDQKRINFCCPIDSPELWWPRGYGKQPLYELEIILLQNDIIVHRIKDIIGLRTVEWKQDKDQWGESFTVCINGRDVFCKGANWIPSDSFLPRVTSEKLNHLLQMAVDANMNMLRVWGGGIYEDSEFYRAADRLGLLIWQDFPYACALYPETPEFLDNARKEAEYIVPQLAHHPSVVLWCGNNEIARDTEEFMREFGVDSVGDTIWDEVLPAVMREFNRLAFYIRSSPTGGEHANDPSYGDRHVWESWSFWQDISDYLDIESRFVSEFGFQAIPHRATMKSVISDNQWWSQSEEVEWHNKQIYGSERLHRFAAAHHRVTTDMDEFIRQSQEVQGRALRTALEHWRRLRPRTMGSLIWQLNDCWPVESWSLVDYYLRPKYSYYQVRRAFAPQTLALAGKEDGPILYLFNDSKKTWTSTVQLRSVTLNGHVKMNRTWDVVVAPDSVQIVFQPELDEWLTDPAGDFLVADLLDTKGNIQDLQVNSEKISGLTFRRSVWFAKRFKHINFPEPHITVTQSSESDNTIQLHTEEPAYGIWIEDDINPDQRFSDNAFDLLLPGETIKVQSSSLVDTKSIRIWSIGQL